MAKRNLVITFAPIMALATLLAVSLQFNGLLMMWKLIRQSKTMPFGPPCWVMKLRCYVIDHLTHALLRRIHPGNRDEVFIWKNFSSPLTEIPVGKTEITVTELGRPLIWTHRKFYKGFRVKARSRKPGQPGQPGSYEEALSQRCSR